MLPSVAALPLLMAYAGHTTIIIPKPIVSYVGFEILDLGELQYCPQVKYYNRLVTAGYSIIHMNILNLAFIHYIW